MEKRAATFLATFRKKAAATLTELSVNRNDNLNSVICLLVVDTELLLCIAMIAQVCVWQLPRVLFFFLHSASNEPLGPHSPRADYPLSHFSFIFFLEPETFYIFTSRITFSRPDHSNGKLHRALTYHVLGHGRDSVDRTAATATRIT